VSDPSPPPLTLYITIFADFKHFSPVFDHFLPISMRFFAVLVMRTNPIFNQKALFSIKKPHFQAKRGFWPPFGF
jgi:hypothetical protein